MTADRIVIEKVDGEWRDGDAQKIVDFLGLPDTAESLDRIGMGLLDYLAGGRRWHLPPFPAVIRCDAPCHYCDSEEGP
jgi:hypothetical protein